jgi:uncharacterized protein (TIGR00297 family)
VAGLTAGELKRKLTHVAVGGFAFLLRWLTWPQAAALAVAAFIFNWQVLPRIGGRGMWREAESARGYARGILLYPVSVLALILVFRHELWKAAAVWGLLAFGDGMASLVGLAAGGRRLPWNAAKSWSGFAAFVVFGTLGALTLAVWTRALPAAALLSPALAGGVLVVALSCALVESLPTTLDDNITVPLAGGLGLWLLEANDGGLRRLLTDARAPGRLLLGLAVNAAIALAAWRARSIDVLGALSAVAIGTAITIGLGLPGLCLMIAFFVVGSVVTRFGYAVKASRGIAQAKGGARGWRNAWANGGVAAVLALLAAGGPDAHLFAVAYAAAVATAAADTCSSEIGKAYGRHTVLITSLRPVPPGTEGAISLEGTLGGLAGGTLVACIGALGGLYSWASAVVVAVAGLLGSLAESVIGTVAERRGWMDNDALNALNTAIGAAAAVALVRLAS